MNSKKLAKRIIKEFKYYGGDIKGGFIPLEAMIVSELDKYSPQTSNINLTIDQLHDTKTIMYEYDYDIADGIKDYISFLVSEGAEE